MPPNWLNNTTVSSELDFHAPLATKKISPKPPNPWMTPAILASIRHRSPSGSCSNVLTPPNTREVLHNLSHVTDAEVRRLVLSAPCKSSDLHPLPTGLVKDCIDVLVTPIVSIVNLSLSERCFLTHFKSALVSPLLKKPTLNRDDMTNYRPVSNLSFLSKILEKVVASCLNLHINSSHTSNDYQSAYRKFYSTETALLKIHNDILSSTDDGRVTAMTLLDLSATLDTIDHTILLRILDNWFGVSGKALDWFKSYLTGRSQRIKLGNCLSCKSDLSFGVPKGSVLGPLLFTLYTTPLSSLISGHAIPHHLYADDSQLYVFFSPGNYAATLNGLQSCLASVQSSMSTNN